MRVGYLLRRNLKCVPVLAVCFRQHRSWSLWRSADARDGRQKPRRQLVASVREGSGAFITQRRRGTRRNAERKSPLHCHTRNCPQAARTGTGVAGREAYGEGSLLPLLDGRWASDSASKLDSLNASRHSVVAWPRYVPCSLRLIASAVFRLTQNEPDETSPDE